MKLSLRNIFKNTPLIIQRICTALSAACLPLIGLSIWNNYKTFGLVVLILYFTALFTGACFTDRKKDDNSKSN